MRKRGLSTLNIVLIVIAVVVIIGIIISLTTENILLSPAPGSKTSTSSDKSTTGSSPSTAKKGSISNYHLECVSNTCTQVAGSGTNQCSGVGTACIPCTDSDGGRNYFLKGNTTWYNTTSGQLDTRTDYCGGLPSRKYLLENYCLNDAGASELKYCDTLGAYTCEDGACVPTNQTNQTHTTCSNQQCITVQGAGTNECTYNSDCIPGNQTNQTLPDLIITSITVNVITNSSGNQTNMTSATVFVTVKNIGDATALVSRTQFSVSTFTPRNIYTLSINPNQQRIIQSTYEPINSGTYSVSSFADILYQIEESNENNNAFGPINFTVP